MDEVNSRILELIERLKQLGVITYDKDFCDIIGLHKQNLNNIKNQRQSFTADQILKMSKVYNVNVNWIFGHEKKIFRTAEPKRIKGLE